MLSFKKNPQMLYIIQKDEMINFFYIDDIISAFKKNWAYKVTKIIEFLLQASILIVVGKFKWFCDFFVIWNHIN